MEAFNTKNEKMLYRAIQLLLDNCVNRQGHIKRPTNHQLLMAQWTLNRYDRKERERRMKLQANNRFSLDEMKNAIEKSYDEGMVKYTTKGTGDSKRVFTDKLIQSITK